MSDSDDDSEPDDLPDFGGDDGDDDSVSFDDDDPFGTGGLSDDDGGELVGDDIDDLFGVSMDDTGPTTGLEALLNSNRVQHNRQPLLEACIDQLVRSLNKTMRAFLSNDVELGLSDTSSVRFGNYIQSIPLPALISVFKLVEWNSYGMICVDSPLIYSTLDQMLGGRKASSPLAVEGRSFTTIEVSLIERMIDQVLREMSVAFKPIAEVTLQHERMESNPSLASIAYPADTGILFKIDFDMDNRGGRLEIMIPYPALEPVRHLLQQMFMGDKSGQDSIWEQHWATEMLMSDVELEVSLGEHILPLNEIMAWQVGATIKLRNSPDDPVTLRCGDTDLLRAKVGKMRDNLAVQIEEWIPQEGT